jgi:hypothetical protein
LIEHSRGARPYEISLCSLVERLLLAATIAGDSRIKSDYLKLAKASKTLNGGKTTKGSLYFMARKINGGS